MGKVDVRQVGWSDESCANSGAYGTLEHMIWGNAQVSLVCLTWESLLEEIIQPGLEL